MAESVKLRLHADVPVGVLLSGGIDSSLVAAIAKKVSAGEVHTYTVGVSDKRYDESAYAGRVAKYLKTRHHSSLLDEGGLLRFIADMPEAYDEPFADSSQIPTMYVSKMAADDGIKVLLSGDGGDELFCGYPVYRDLMLLQKADWVGEALYRAGAGRWSLPFAARAVIHNRDKRYKTQCNLYGYSMAADQFVPHGDGYFDESGIPEGRWFIRRMILDMDSFLADDILCKVDRASMFYSVETRNPLLDINVVNLALSMKPALKYYRGQDKRLLRDVLYGLLPKGLLERPKRGFSVPIGKWMKGRLRGELMDYADRSYLKKQGLFHAENTQKAIKKWLSENAEPGRGQNMEQIIWAFFNFQRWYQRYMKRAGGEK